jgi:ElaB/YqjD/DUF883 family membrane-anchored ribosome-binding protein
MVKEKDETNQHLQGELQSLRLAYKTLLQQHGPNSPSTARRNQEKDTALSSLREELDHVKQEYVPPHARTTQLRWADTCWRGVPQPILHNGGGYQAQPHLLGKKLQHQHRIPL